MPKYNKDLMMITRLALTGKTVGPDLFKIMELLGKEKCLERLRKAQKRIQELQNLPVT